MVPHANEDPRPTVLAEAAALAADYLAGLGKRPVASSPPGITSLALLGGSLPEEPAEALDVVRLLDQYASPATPLCVHTARALSGPNVRCPGASTLG
jgi:hypothetical protein